MYFSQHCDVSDGSTTTGKRDLVGQAVSWSVEDSCCMHLHAADLLQRRYSMRRFSLRRRPRLWPLPFSKGLLSNDTLRYQQYGINVSLQKA